MGKYKLNILIRRGGKRARDMFPIFSDDLKYLQEELKQNMKEIH